MARMTVEQALQRAPDEASRRGAKALVRPGLWSGLGANDTLVWGSCQGSSRAPYDVSVALDEGTARCTCPSFKYPCKHAVALLVIWAARRGDVAGSDTVPDFVEARRASIPSSPQRDTPDPVALAARVATRLATMDTGLDLLDAWLGDIVRHGVADIRSRSPRWWDETAARLVDAQLPALADRVRALSSAIHQRADWPDALVTELARIGLVSRAWRSRDGLDPDAWADVRTQLGWAWQGHEVAGGDTLSGLWSVVGVVEDEEGRVRSQRTWLRDATGAFAVIYDFAAGGAQFGVSHVVGTSIEATVVAYPGSTLPRVKLASEPVVVGHEGTLGPAAPVESLCATVREHVARNPFLHTVPVVLGPVSLAVDDGAWWITDSTGSIPVASTNIAATLANTGAWPFSTFGEWSDGGFSIQSIACASGVVMPV